MLESLHTATEAWHSIDTASRREAHDAICRAVTVFPSLDGSRQVGPAAIHENITGTE